MRLKTLRTRISLLVLITSIMALLVSGSAFFGYEVWRLQSEKISAARRTAQLLAGTVQAAVMFGDERAAAEVLQTLKSDPNISSVAVIDGHERLLAEYHAEGFAELAADVSKQLPSQELREGAVHVSVAVLDEKEQIGKLHLVYRVSDWGSLIAEGVGVSFLILFVSGLGALFVASHVGRKVTQPLETITATIKEVAQSASYGARVSYASEDELGSLASQFNLLLSELQERDRRLSTYRLDLEREVESRTADLSREVARRAEVENALLREQRQLRAIIMNAPIAVAMFDMNLRYLVHSAAWLAEYGLVGQNIIGRSHYEVFPDIPERWKAMHQEALRGNRQRSSEDRFDRADGGSIYLRWAVEPWYTPTGQQGGLIMVTERIDELVKAREAAIHHATLKTQFLTNMSHELRTPLNAIIGFADLLAEDSEMTPSQREQVESIVSSGRVLLAVINDILDFSKLERGKVEIENEPFRVREILSTVITMIRQEAEAKGLRASWECDPQIPRSLCGDAFRLQQVLVNLAGNAVKFTEHGGITIGAKVLAAAGKGWQLEFSVTDTGIGIPPEKAGRIFEAFTQADGSTTRKYGGTGLGLSISRELVELMGGNIWVEAAPGGGSRFLFTVPLSEAKQADLNHTSQTGSEADVSFRSPLHVLVVEDNLVNQKLIRSILERAGHHVTLAHNGAEAVRCTENGSFDIVLMDLQMPVLGGIEAAGKIRAQEKEKAKARVPIVALTAHASEQHRAECLKHDMDGYVTKPLRREELFSTIKRVTES